MNQFRPFADQMASVLFPKAASEYISKNSKDVSINHEGIEHLSQKLYEQAFSREDWHKHSLNPKEADESAINWIFVVDTLNFSFWNEDEAAAYYSVTYEDKSYHGYWSMCAVINRALDAGVPLTSAAYYCNIDLDTAENLFRSSNGTRPPLLDERVKVLNETGRILLEKFSGSFVNCIKQANNSATRLLQLIVEHFPSYRDEATFHGQRVGLYKRAQIVVADLWACFRGSGLGYFSDIDEITMFADYRVPQVLVYFDVLHYSEDLMTKLRRGDHLENGSREEVEIRGNTIWAGELIAAELKSLAKEEPAGDQSMNAILIDYYLWEYRRAHAEDLDHIPFHKTRCIYY